MSAIVILFLLILYHPLYITCHTVTETKKQLKRGVLRSKTVLTDPSLHVFSVVLDFFFLSFCITETGENISFLRGTEVTQLL